MDTITPSAPLSEPQLRAVTEVVLLVGYADGTLDEVERERLIRRLIKLSFNTVEQSALEAMIQESEPPRPLRREWRAERLLALGQVLATPELRRAAFVVALEVANADGRIGLREASTLAMAASEFGLNSGAVVELMREVQEEA